EDKIAELEQEIANHKQTISFKAQEIHSLQESAHHLEKQSSLHKQDLYALWELERGLGDDIYSRLTDSSAEHRDKDLYISDLEHKVLDATVQHYDISDQLETQNHVLGLQELQLQSVLNLLESSRSKLLEELRDAQTSFEIEKNRVHDLENEM